VAQIAERTDGVPLFVEELTKAVIEGGGQVLSSVPHRASLVPATLQTSLMARLDRLGSNARDVAQTGAAIGREFGYELLAAVTDLPEAPLCAALDRLTDSGLVLIRGAPPNASYIFKHALVQDAAYGTLLRDRRRRLHARIAVNLEQRFPEIVAAQPAVLAQHCTDGGFAEKAIAYWLKAGRQAHARSSTTEAIAQLRKGLEVVFALPDSPRRQQQELDLRVALGAALTFKLGFLAAETVENRSRARRLAQQLDRPEQVVLQCTRQWMLHFLRAEHGLAVKCAKQLETIGEARNDAVLQSLGQSEHGMSLFHLGEFAVARDVLEQSIGHAAPAPWAVGVSADPYATTLAALAMTLALLGYIDQARSRIDEALSEARRLRHVVPLVHVLFVAVGIERNVRLPEVHAGVSNPIY
jgi:predicted ATPase